MKRSKIAQLLVLGGTASLTSAQAPPEMTVLRYADETAAATFSQANAWRDRSDAPQSLAGSNPNLTLLFRPRAERDYSVTNDLVSKDAPLEVHALVLAPPVKPMGSQRVTARIAGNTIALVPSGSGEAPTLTLGARDPRHDAIEFEVRAPIHFSAPLTIRGDGNQLFRFSGNLRGADDAGLTKEGTARLELAGENSWKAATVIRQGAIALRDGLSLGTGPLNIEAGASLTLLPQAPRAGLSSALAIAEKGKLELNGGHWIVDYDTDSPLFFLQTMVKDGRIGSATLAVNQTIACVEASTVGLTEFAGRTIDKDVVIVAVARPGDTNLDFKVDLEDLKRVNAAFNKAGTWADGDVTNDGRVDFEDLLKITQNYDSKDTFEADWRSLQ